MVTTIDHIDPNGRYNTVQAAKLLGICRTTLWKLTNAGTLKPRFEKHSMRARFRGKDLIAFWKAEI